MADKTKSLVARIKDYFGMTIAEVRAEYPSLTIEDRAELCAEFSAMGLPTEIKTSAK